jgi:hypothetical protein
MQGEAQTRQIARWPHNPMVRPWADSIPIAIGTPPATKARRLSPGFFLFKWVNSTKFLENTKTTYAG